MNTNVRNNSPEKNENKISEKFYRNLSKGSLMYNKSLPEIINMSSETDSNLYDPRKRAKVSSVYLCSNINDIIKLKRQYIKNSSLVSPNKNVDMSKNNIRIIREKPMKLEENQMNQLNYLYNSYLNNKILQKEEIDQQNKNLYLFNNEESNKIRFFNIRVQKEEIDDIREFISRYKAKKCNYDNYISKIRKPRPQSKNPDPKPITLNSIRTNEENINSSFPIFHISKRKPSRNPIYKLKSERSKSIMKHRERAIERLINRVILKRKKRIYYKSKE